MLAEINRNPAMGLWVDIDKLTFLRQGTYTFRGAVADRWPKGRVFLLGDAAHLTPPFIGQGMCAGIRDAAQLAWRLALVVQGHADERLLDTYQAERRPTRGWCSSPSSSAG